MANLIYSTAASLDSYIADETGNLDLVGARRGDILRSSPISSAPSACISRDARCTR